MALFRGAERRELARDLPAATVALAGALLALQPARLLLGGYVSSASLLRRFGVAAEAGLLFGAIYLVILAVYRVVSGRSRIR